MAQDNFVDLYEILQLPQNADVEKIKQRIREKYLEAQQNLDHRNAQKKLHFQQLYEVYLPQARHLLLDANHRAEYDRYLQAFRSGKAPQAFVPTKAVAGKPQIPSASEDNLIAMDGDAIDPQKLVEQRESLWQQWKSGLEAPAPPVASTRDAAPAAGNELSAANSYTPATGTEQAAPRQRARREWKAPDKDEEAVKRRLEGEERQRQRDHEKMTAQKAEVARKIYGISGGVLFLLLLPLYIVYLKSIVRPSVLNFVPGGTGEGILNIVAPIIIVVLAFFFSQWAAEFGYAYTFKKHKVKMPTPGDRMGL